MNKTTKPILRLWLSITSILVFVAGWIALAHAPKPAPLSTQIVDFVAPAAEVFQPELVPVPSLEDLSQTVNTTTFVQPTTNFSQPRLRTRGS